MGSNQSGLKMNVTQVRSLPVGQPSPPDDPPHTWVKYTTAVQTLTYCLTLWGSLPGRGLTMTITAAPQPRAPFPVCFIFHGDGPTSHRSDKGFTGLSCDLLNQNRRTADWTTTWWLGNFRYERTEKSKTLKPKHLPNKVLPVREKLDEDQQWTLSLYLRGWSWWGVTSRRWFS